jgi:hypothetical protein
MITVLTDMQKRLLIFSCITLLVAHPARAQTNSNIITISGGFAYSADSISPVRQKHQLVLLWRDDAPTRTVLDSTCSITRHDPATWRTLRIGPDHATRQLNHGAQRYAPLLNQTFSAIVDTAWTDSVGTFAFHNVPGGDYYVFTELRNSGAQISQWWQHVSVDGTGDVRMTFYVDRYRSEQFCRPRLRSTDSVNAANAYLESEVEIPAYLRPGQPRPIYPPELRDIGAEADIDVRFVVDTTDRADMTTFTVVNATDPRFVPTVRNAIARDRFRPAEIAGRKVRQIVPWLATFSITR